MVKVGGEVDSFCGKCELTLAHTVHALVGSTPVKVECNTCHAVHRYRAPQGSSGGAGGASATQRKAARPAREKKVEIGFDELLAKYTKAPVPYSARRTFAEDEVVDHPAFGRGFVSGVRGDKVEITFRSDVKVLVHGRG
jgi:hypothetical protein